MSPCKHVRCSYQFLPQVEHREGSAPAQSAACNAQTLVILCIISLSLPKQPEQPSYSKQSRCLVNGDFQTPAACSGGSGARYTIHVSIFDVKELCDSHQSKGYTIPQAAVLSSPCSCPAIPKHTPGLIKDQLSTLPLHVQVQMLFDYLHKLPGRMRGHNFLATPASLTSFNKCPIFSITIAFRHSVDDMSKSLKYSLHVHNTLQLHPVWGR